MRLFIDKDGKDREVTEIIASDVQFLDPAGTKSADLPADAPEDDGIDVADIPF